MKKLIFCAVIIIALSSFRKKIYINGHKAIIKERCVKGHYVSNNRMITKTNYSEQINYVCDESVYDTFYKK